jgi:hypothetical protein
MTVEKARELLQAEDRKVCGSCGEKLYSPFDVLFMHTYSVCLDCLQKEKTDEEIEEMSKPIFDLINNL